MSSLFYIENSLSSLKTLQKPIIFLDFYNLYMLNFNKEQKNKLYK